MKLSHLYIIIACFLVSCARPRGLIFRDVETAHINLKNEVPVKLMLRLYNPNYHSVTVRNAAAYVHINNNYLGRFVIEEGFRVRKRHSFLLPFTLTADVEKEFPAIKELQADSSIFLRLDGTITAGKKRVCVTSAIFFEGNEPLEKSELKQSDRKRKR